jgi:hypothetical protein
MADSAMPTASASSPRPIGGDGARAVVTRVTGGGAEPCAGADGVPDGSDHTGHNGVGHNGSGHSGAGHDGPGHDGAGHCTGNGSVANGHHVPRADVAPRAAILPAAPPGLAPEAAAGDGPSAGPEPAGDALPVGAAAGAADARDRLLAMLLPDPARAVALVAAAEQARDAARRARRELAAHRRDLDRAGEELLAQGLTADQVCRLLELSDEESPARGGRHREPHSSADPQND